MPVLGTKLHVPWPRRALVPRARLTDRLTSAAPAAPRLVLIAAPAGFGKTTLLTQWLATREPGCAVAWLSLDEADDDPRSFLTHLLAAVRSASGGGRAVGAHALALLGDDDAAAVPTPDVLVSLINDLDTAAGRTVLALDDYHVICSPVVHQAVGFLLDNLPPAVTLAITTRADPPLALARLRARGQLVELRAADLRFTGEEAAAFLNTVMGLGLAARHVAALEARTEGWVAGLQLAALSAGSRPRDPADLDTFIADFAGSNRFVLDYLVAEVLQRQSEPVRSFLLSTCVLAELSGPGCDAVTGRRDGQRTLEALEQANLFLVPLDDQRRWWRYHHLFADALRARLAGQDPDAFRSRHRLAAEWYADQGQVSQAVPHALAAGDHRRAADLVELTVADLRRRRQDRTLRRWLAALPEQVVRERPLLSAHLGWSRLSEGRLEEAGRWLDAAQAGLGALAPAGSPPGLPDAPGSAPRDGAERARALELQALPSMIELYRAGLGQARGDLDATVAHARRAHDLAAAGNDFARGAAAGFLGLAAWAQGDLVAAVDWFSAAAAALHAAGMVTDELGTTVVLGRLWLARGRPVQARRLHTAALAVTDRHRGPVLSTTGDLHVGLADVLREQGDLEGAAAHLEVARELGDRASLPENRHRWYTSSAGLLRAQGRLEAAVAMLDRAEAMVLPGFFPDVRPVPAARARIRIAQGHLEQARAWAEQVGVSPADAPTFLAEDNLLTLARLLVLEGEPGKAVTLTDVVLAEAAAAGRGGSVVEARLTRALAHRAGGDRVAAGADLAAALTLGVPAGYCRLFLDEGAPLLELLGHAARSATGEVRQHAEQLLQAARRPVVLGGPVDGPAGGSADAQPGGPAREALSGRELDVLRLLAGELTGPEIAHRLFISINTLRTHTKRIFSKLGVSTRRAAVARAVELGLL